MQSFIICLLSVLVMAGMVPRAAGQFFDVPPIACPQYFQYLQDGDEYIGRITLPNVPYGTAKVEVTLSQRIPVNSNYYGRLSLYDDQQVTLRNLQNGMPIAYRVEFPTPNVLPKLTRISINGNILCSDNGYPPPSTILNLEHSLITTQTQVGNSRPLPNDLNFDIIGGVVQPATSNRPVFQMPTFQIPPAYVPPTASYTPPANTIPTTNTRPTINTRPTVNTRPTTNTRPTFNTRPTTNTRPSTALTPSPTTMVRSPFAGQQCGIEDNIVVPFIYGGTTLVRGQFPWLSAIYWKQALNTRYICGGSLISARTVITAAHCFRITNIEAQNVVVHLGRYNLLKTREEGAEVRDVTALIIHQEYDSNSISDADLALLQLDQPVDFNRYIRPICLWSETTDTSVIVGLNASIAGWGATGQETVSPMPKSVSANIVSELECVRSLDVFGNLATSRTICAGNRDGTGPCTGDSGSGLMIERNGVWMLRGIVSVGQTVRRQCNLREFVLYCDVAKHMSWVRQNLV